MSKRILHVECPTTKLLGSSNIPDVPINFLQHLSGDKCVACIDNGVIADHEDVAKNEDIVMVDICIRRR